MNDIKSAYKRPLAHISGTYGPLAGDSAIKLLELLESKGSTAENNNLFMGNLKVILDKYRSRLESNKLEVSGEYVYPLVIDTLKHGFNVSTDPDIPFVEDYCGIVDLVTSNYFIDFMVKHGEKDHRGNCAFILADSLFDDDLDGHRYMIKQIIGAADKYTPLEGKHRIIVPEVLSFLLGVARDDVKQGDPFSDWMVRALGKLNFSDISAVHQFYRYKELYEKNKESGTLPALKKFISSIH